MMNGPTLRPAQASLGGETWERGWCPIKEIRGYLTNFIQASILNGWRENISWPMLDQKTLLYWNLPMAAAWTIDHSNQLHGTRASRSDTLSPARAQHYRSSHTAPNLSRTGTREP